MQKLEEKNLFSVFSDTSSDSDLLRLRCDAQSMSYYSDISAYLCRRILSFDTLSVLDVGSRTGSGLALLRLLHHPQSFARLKLDPVNGIDEDPEFERSGVGRFPDIGGCVAAIDSLPDASYDLVVCGHVLEYSSDPVAFVKQLERVAKRAVLLRCPHGLDPNSPIQIVSFSKDFFTGLGFGELEIYESLHWHESPCCMAFKWVGAK